MDLAVHHPLIRVLPVSCGKQPGAASVHSVGISAHCKQRILRMRCLVCSLLAVCFLTSGDCEPSASLVFLGDIMLGRGVADAHAGGDWGSVLQTLQPLTRAADLALATLESPFLCEEVSTKDPRSLAAPPEAAAALTSSGLDVLSIVNNHAQDAGPEGIRCTIRALADLGITSLDSPLVEREITAGGVPFVFLAFDFTGDVQEGAVETIERRIRLASGAGKFVVVSLHWGLEYQSGHDALQERIASQFADARAGILWGHHPHVSQDIAWRNRTLILYSLGNAVFDQYKPEGVRHGTLVWAEVDRRGIRWIAVLPFAVDPLRGKTGPLDLLSARIFSAPI
jgi:poly-gamma-glutamate capsule biosynthesis protein CapA/YwtB (metallophosphatase superfamily)